MEQDELRKEKPSVNQEREAKCEPGSGFTPLSISHLPSPRTRGPPERAGKCFVSCHSTKDRDLSPHGEAESSVEKADIYWRAEGIRLGPLSLGGGGH